jgi:hypothetical protein
MAVTDRIRIRRMLTETPLARQHDATVAGRSTRKVVDVPWSKFRRSRYPAPALALACTAQTMLATGEYEAVDLFARIAAGMVANGVPIDLIAAATRAASDEIRHCDYAFRMAALLGGSEVAIEMRRARAQARWRSSLDMETLDALMIEIPAIGEGLACALLAASRERASDPVVRPLFTSILGDEVHHTRLGWYYLAWRAPQWTRSELQRAADRAGEIVVDIERRFWWGRDAPAGSRKAARALGVLESVGQREVISRIMGEEIIPALDELGLGTSHAWRVRRRGSGSA